MRSHEVSPLDRMGHSSKMTGVLTRSHETSTEGTPSREGREGCTSEDGCRDGVTPRWLSSTPDAAPWTPERGSGTR